MFLDNVDQLVLESEKLLGDVLLQEEAAEENVVNRNLKESVGQWLQRRKFYWNVVRSQRSVLSGVPPPEENFKYLTARTNVVDVKSPVSTKIVASSAPKLNRSLLIPYSEKKGYGENDILFRFNGFQVEESATCHTQWGIEERETLKPKQQSSKRY